MADLFNKQIKTPTGAFSVDRAQLTFGNVAGGGLLIQNVQIQYSQNMSFLYDLSEPSAVYYVAGRAQGTIAIGKAVGTSQAFTAFYTQYGDVCNTAGGVWSVSGVTGCTNGSGSTTNTSMSLVMHNPKIAGIGIGMQIETAIINENIQAVFTNLEVS